jgi:hypothetical protein
VETKKEEAEKARKDGQPKNADLFRLEGKTPVQRKRSELQKN